MAMAKSIEMGSIVTGSIMLFFAAIIVICGAVVADKLTGEATAWIGLWSLYYAVPGTLCIIAGIKKHVTVLGVALFFNILGAIVSGVASIIAIIFVASMDAVSSFDSCNPSQTGDECVCSESRERLDRTYKMSCDDLEAVHSIVITVLVMYIFLLVTTLTASILGCMGLTCCAPAQPVVVVTPGMPLQTIGGGTVIVASNQGTMNAAYPSGPAMSATYSQAPPPAYDINQLPTYGNNNDGFEKLAM